MSGRSVSEAGLFGVCRPRPPLAPETKSGAAVASEVPETFEARATDLAVALPAPPQEGRDHRAAVYRRTFVLADALAATGAVFLSAALFRKGYSVLAVIAVAPLIVLMSKLIGSYSRQDLLLRKSTLDEAPAVFQLATLYALTVWLIDGFFLTGAKHPGELLLLWIAVFLLLLIFRATARSVSKSLTAPERCLIVGDATMCDTMQLKVARHPSLHTVVVASVTDAELSPHPSASLGQLSIEELRELALQHRVERIIVTPTRADDEAIANIVQAAGSLGLKVSVAPRLLELVGSSAQFDDFGGLPLLSARPLRLTRASRLLKRSVDIIGSTLGLLISAPLFSIVAVAIKLDSEGPTFFRQPRIGRHGNPFGMLKFRTMVLDADAQKQGLQEFNEAKGLFKIANDPRITRVGRLLRRTSLDELPQLLNVIRGEMSLVGPRPLIAEEDSRIEGWHRRRLHLTPGMTGHWQILGSARIPLSEMVQIDYLYVANWSLWLDLKILLRTIPYVLARRGV